MELVHHKKYKQHQEACRHRQVICPSNFCDKMMAFSEVKEHAGTLVYTTLRVKPCFSILSC